MNNHEVPSLTPSDEALRHLLMRLFHTFWWGSSIPSDGALPQSHEGQWKRVTWLCGVESDAVTTKPLWKPFILNWCLF